MWLNSQKQWQSKEIRFKIMPYFAQKNNSRKQSFVKIKSDKNSSGF